MKEESMPRVAIRFGSLVAALAVASVGLTGAASAASVPSTTEQQAVSNAMHAQLARAPGGMVRGDSIVYGADHVTVKYVPKTAQGARVALAADCDENFLCMYKYTGWGTQVLGGRLGVPGCPVDAGAVGSDRLGLRRQQRLGRDLQLLGRLGPVRR